MIWSQDLNELAPALSTAQGEFETVAKTADNPFFKSKYADLPSVVKAASPILAKNGLAVIQTLGNDTLSTTLLHKSGQYVGDTAHLHLVKLDPQAHGSAITYMRRYAYMAILGLVADVDDDANSATPPITQTHTVRREAPSRPVAASKTQTQTTTALETF